MTIKERDGNYHSIDPQYITRITAYKHTYYEFWVLCVRRKFGYDDLVLHVESEAAAIHAMNTFDIYTIERHKIDCRQ